MAIIKEVRPLPLSLILAALVTLGACKQNIQNEEAVRQGILNYLSKRQDLGKMDVSVTKVAFRQDEADATVHFQAKDSNAPNTGIDFQYTLERKGNEWVVKGKATGTGGHGAGGMPPPPGGTETPNTPAQLPPGHPAMPTPPGQTKLPPGHPTTPTPGPAK